VGENLGGCHIYRVGVVESFAEPGGERLLADNRVVGCAFNVSVSASSICDSNKR
jgi:hypothetical protein